MADALWDMMQQLDIWGLQSQLNRSNRSQSRRDREQDQRILALEEENKELRLHLTVLVNLLVAKGVFSAEEIGSIISALEAETNAKRCPSCGFTYQWDGVRCGHCSYQAEAARDA
jgi:hypothetical protein